MGINKRTADQEVMGRVFNALWREDFARSRRWTRVCGRQGAAFAVIKLDNGIEVMARLDRMHGLDSLSTSFPYYARFLPFGNIEQLNGAEELAALLPAG